MNEDFYGILFAGIMLTILFSHLICRQISSDNILPSVSEGVVSPCSESSNETDSIV